MEKWRVLLVCEQPLLGESLENTLRLLEDVELVGCWRLEDCLPSRLAGQHIDLLIFAEADSPGEQITRLTAQLLDACPDLSIVRVALSRKDLRLYTSQSVPARTADLIDLIHHLRS
jgi:DNA-binding NarL/FixJ family response regulator